MGVERRLRVKAGLQEYPIFLGTDLLNKTGEILKKEGLVEKVLVVTNPRVSELYLDSLLKGLEQEGFSQQVVVIPDGEKYKRLDQVEKVYDTAVSFRLERSSVMVALGGGVIGDLTGLAAATYLRGVKFVQIPTTLLAQVDSSIGGKVAVNHRAGKNLIGAFYQPSVVITDLKVLNTLEEREFKTGLAEIIKAGLIGDQALYEYLLTQSAAVKGRSTEALLEIIEKSCLFKAQVVEEDVFEKGRRAILNYGHTIGHALEAETNYTLYRHGEAVAIGMVGAVLISQELRLCQPKVREQTLALLELYDLPQKLPGISVEKIIARMALDKKVKNGKLRLILTTGIGEAVLKDDLQLEMIARILCQMGASRGG